MKIYGHHGITDFVICLGYKGYMIKAYFANCVLHNSDVTMDAKSNRVAVPRPVYNAGRFLARALDAIVAQTLSDLELTVIDDGPS